MGDGMYIAHIGFGKGAASIEGGLQHILPGFQVGAVFVYPVQILEDQLHCT